MRIRNKEHQSLGLEQLKELSYDFPNDAQLGEERRRIIRRATTNNPKGERATSHYPHELKENELEAWESFITDINEREL